MKIWLNLFHETFVTSIDYFVMSSSGGGNDFGDLIEASNAFGGLSNDTRGIYGGAYPSYNGVLSSVIIATTGSASSFGSLIAGSVASTGGINSPTRGIFSGLEVSPVLGGSGTSVIRTEFVTILSTGNSQEFGDLSVGRNANAGCSSSTRGLSMGGLTPSLSDVIDFCTIATLGDFIDFGNLTAAKYAIANGVNSFPTTSYAVASSAVNGTCTAAPAGLTCLNDAAAGRFNDLFNSNTNCHAFAASSKLI